MPDLLDVAELLARHPMPWRVKLAYAIDANGNTVLDDHGYAPDPRQLFDTLETALRAALADQRRIDWLNTQRRPYSLPPTRMIVGTEWSVKLHHQEQPNATLRAAIDAAMTADGEESK